MAESVRIFLSTVSAEFRAYRYQLCHDLTRPDVGAIVQEEFKAHGGTTLDKLDDYIKPCEAVVHLVGDMTGGPAKEPATQAILKQYPDLPKKLTPLGEALRQGVPISYTQWEAWLALYHGKVLIIAKANEAAPRGLAYAPTDESRASQQAHVARLATVGHYHEIIFKNPDDLAKQIAYSTILDLLAEARAKVPTRKPSNLPFPSLGPLFKGREESLEKLHQSLQLLGPPHRNGPQRSRGPSRNRGAHSRPWAEAIKVSIGRNFPVIPPLQEPTCARRL